MKNLLFLFPAPYLFAAITTLFSITAAAAADKPTVSTSYSESMVGDHLELRTNVTGFLEAGNQDNPPPKKCAPVGSKLAVQNINLTNQTANLYFLSVEQEKPGFFSKLFGSNNITEADLTTALAACPSDKSSAAGTMGTADTTPKNERVNNYTMYTIDKKILDDSAFKRTGIAFGALIVPFKFRLGNAKALVSSATLAPYIGFRTPLFQSLGVTFTPILSAGLGLVPVANASGKGTDSKAAFSTAMGWILTSNKDDKFSVGALVGRDFLGRADREADSAVNKMWISLYIGLGF
ncbi:MAG: hypothetical protein Q8K74_06165 [Candidatus Nitrotoga sp.]|nr:hypothetical protein [Candidatus Nitrotoga sp.]MDP1855621.1 hypothetical protein [Candidatus Nitrotoga sp.]